MKRRIISCMLAIVMSLMTILPVMLASARQVNAAGNDTQSQAKASSGEWVLIEASSSPDSQEVERKNDNDYDTFHISADPNGSKIELSGTQRAQTFDWSTDDQKVKESHETGNWRATLIWDRPPQRIRAGTVEELSFISTYSYSPAEGYRATGEYTHSLHVVNQMEPDAAKAHMGFNMDWRAMGSRDSFGDTQTAVVECTFGNGTEMAEQEGQDPNDYQKKFTVSYSTNRSGNLQAQIELVYSWVPAEQNGANFILKGYVLSVTKQLMPGLLIEMTVFDNADEKHITRGRAETFTDEIGLFEAGIDIPTDMKSPCIQVSMYLRAYHDGYGNYVFNLIDEADTVSAEYDGMNIFINYVLNDDEISVIRSGGKLKRVEGFNFQRLLRKQDPSFSTMTDQYKINLIPSITDSYVWEDDNRGKHSVEKELSAEKRMAYASFFYCRLFDAYLFNRDQLKLPHDDMKKWNVKVYLRDKEANQKDSAWFDENDGNIYIGSHRSELTDLSVFTLQHEFGHVTDYYTSDSSGFRLTSPSDDTPHKGIVNSSMNDSFTEGFATAYAGLVARYSKYKNPDVLDWIDLSYPNPKYCAYDDGGQNEELAIALFLYQAEKNLGIKSFWEALKPTDKSDFKAYFDTLLKANAEKKAELEKIAVDVALYSMPFPGNNKYDKGEPFADVNENGVRDEGEVYYDLTFEWKSEEVTGKDGESTQIWKRSHSNAEELKRLNELYKKKTAEPQKPTEPVLGIVSDYTRIDKRRATPTPSQGYLAVSGDVPDGYVVVRIRPDGEEGMSALRSVEAGRVFLFEPSAYDSGTVTVEIPGGGIFYESRIEDFAAKAYTTAAYDTADSAAAGPEHAAPEDVIPVPTFGDVNADGSMIIPDPGEEDAETEYERLSSGEGSHEEPTSDEGNGSPVVDDYPEPGDYFLVDSDEEEGGVLSAIVLILIVVTPIVIVIRLIKKKKETKNSTNDASAAAGRPVQTGRPQMTRRFCRYCGCALPQEAVFCRNCGKKLS
ncbi:MAG: hypothetical protein K6B72_07475 [Lachnospiraceae bacterium]|nr:hypothetical protein [Lachnospiraceae bacterium]